MSFQLNTTLPNLFVSQSQLQFPPTEVGEEVFLLVKIGQDGVNLPIRVSSESAAPFRVAVQASPLRFGVETTFTPMPGGTFVHVRYAPGQAGRHEGELLIETGLTTRSIALSGHTRSLLSRALGSSRPGLIVAVTALLFVVGAVVYWGATHRLIVGSWLTPGAQKEPVAGPAPSIPARQEVARTSLLPAVLPKARTPKPKRTAPLIPASEVTSARPTQPEAAPARLTRNQPVATPPADPSPEPVRPPAGGPSAVRQTAVAPSARTRAERPAPPRIAATTDTPKKRPVAPLKRAEPSSAESDLEKALNGNQ